jgi:hypothetical protein
MAAQYRSPQLAAAAQNRSHTWAGQKLIPCPYFPRRTGWGFWFPSDGANDGDAVVVPQNSLSLDAEIANEGVPFRCLGLHTHRNAPAEAQARFSEDPSPQQLQKRESLGTPDLQTDLQDESYSSTARHYRQARHNSQNPLNISTSSTGVNQF